MTVPASTSVPASMVWDSTRTAEDSLAVAPEKRMNSPAPVAAVLASGLPPEEKMARLHRQGADIPFSLLPFRSVGTPAGLLLAARSDYIEINGRRYPRTPVALSDYPVSDGGGYHALWGDPEGEEVKGRADSTAAPSADASVQTPQAG